MQIEKEGTTLEQLRTGQRAKIGRAAHGASARRPHRAQQGQRRRSRGARRTGTRITPTFRGVPARLDLSRILVTVQPWRRWTSAAVRRAEIVAGRLCGGRGLRDAGEGVFRGAGRGAGRRDRLGEGERLDPALAEAVRGLEPGQTTKVILSGRGAHLLRVEEVGSRKRACDSRRSSSSATRSAASLGRAHPGGADSLTPARGRGLRRGRRDRFRRSRVGSEGWAYGPGRDRVARDRTGRLWRTWRWGSSRTSWRTRMHSPSSS